MGWKKDAKKLSKEMNVFNTQESESSYIEWQRTYSDINTWTEEYVENEIAKYYNLTIKCIENQRYPISLKAYDEKLLLGFIEKFDAYLIVSKFKYTYEFLQNTISKYASKIVMLSLTKFVYFTTLKFWAIFNSTFSNKNVNDPKIMRIFKSMQKTSLEAIDNMLSEMLEIMDGLTLDPYKNHLTIEELVDLGEQETWHWTKMFDQVVDLTIETFIFETQYGTTTEYTQNTRDYTFDNDFNDFFEKTKTMVFNDELSEAMNYFGLFKTNNKEDFKRIYRKLAKEFHPDVNKNPIANIEMKKINIYKNILEKYYTNVEN